MNEKIKNLEDCIDECLKWHDDTFNELNESQKTEFIRLKNLVSSTKNFYKQVLDIDKDESWLSKFIDNFFGNIFNKTQRLVILQIERDFYTADISLIFMYKFIHFEKKWMKLEDSNNKNSDLLNEYRLTYHLYNFYIEEKIFKLLTNQKSNFLPRTFFNLFES